MICVSLDEQYSANYLTLLTKACFAEVRMDRMTLSLDDVKTIFSHPATLIATYRPGNVDDRTRRSYLFAAIEAGAAYVDVEVDSDNAYKKEIVKKARSKGCTVIISFHDHEKTPEEEELRDIVSLCFREGARIAKVACMVNSPADNARLLGLLGREDLKGKLVVVGMGEKGRITRVAAPLLGSPFTFASLAKGKETAEGQIEKERLEEIMRLIDGK
jgi:3-dehydroquinate dehydratase-1